MANVKNMREERAVRSSGNNKEGESRDVNSVNYDEGVLTLLLRSVCLRLSTHWDPAARILERAWSSVERTVRFITDLSGTNRPPLLHLHSLRLPLLGRGMSRRRELLRGE